MSKVIINLENISKVFQVRSQQVVVLKKTTVQINEGEFTIVFGPSGCGKSTLLHIMLGLETPTTGNAIFFDTDLYSLTDDQRSEFRKSNVGMIYQQPNWIKSLSVIENVIFSASLLGWDFEKASIKAKEMLNLVGMLNWADYKPTELSSGQQQKISLARALITDPKVIIADEPTGNLDYQSGIDLMNLFQSLQKEGKTIVMVTHNIENLDYASSIIQMFDGTVRKVIDTSKVNIETVKKEITQKLTPIPVTNEDIPVEKPKTADFQHYRFISRKGILAHIASIRHSFKPFLRNVGEVMSFVAVLFLYLAQKVIKDVRFLPRFLKSFLTSIFNLLFNKVYAKLGKNEEQSISKTDLIDISLKNMLSKKTRSIITIGGMAIGIGTIVFLVSIGYGLEKMVISRVARLNEMKQVDAVPAVSSNIKITDKSLNDFKNITGIQKVLPIIGSVSKINYHNSNTDVVVYGVLADYLKESAIKPSYGKIFEENNTTNQVTSGSTSSEVKGISTETEQEVATYNQKINSVEYSIDPGIFVRVREIPNVNGKIIGYTKRTEGLHEGTQVWGSSYESEDGNGEAGEDAQGKKLGKWVKDSVLIWEEKTCTPEEKGCEKGKFLPKNGDDGSQVQQEGYFAMLGVTASQSSIASVLGITSSDSASLAAPASTDEADLAIAALTNSEKPKELKKVTFNPTSKREMVVNKALLKVLGINANDGLKKAFSISFITTGDTNNGEKIESYPVDYTIIGVVPDEKTPIAYVPFIDLKQLGVTTYSEVKLVMNSQNELPKIRKQVEVLGYKTSSVVDTVSQIERLFGTVRLLLGLLGVVALAVAALGMFNTLTVSLLERTHEVGMMKAIGMKSAEVQDLFLTESMIMGIFGGLSGILIGFIGGKIISIILTLLAVYKGIGIVDISYIPFPFIVMILFLSVTVGVATGIYPARRATKISALDALRYE